MPRNVEERVQKLEMYWYVTAAVAAIFGFTGANVYHQLSILEGRIKELQESTEVLSGKVTSETNEIKKESDIAVSTVRAEATRAVQQAATTVVGDLQARVVQLEKSTLKDFEFSKEVTWGAGAPAAPLSVRVGEGVCFLTMVTGDFADAGEKVQIEVGNDGTYYLNGKSNRTTVQASARCVTVRRVTSAQSGLG